MLGFHDLMVHDYGPGQRFASIHVEMDQREDPLRCHELIDEMERECLRSHNIHLVIHYDPVVTDDPELQEQKETVEIFLGQWDSRLSIHDFRMVRGEGRRTLYFDVILPDDLRGREQRLQWELEQFLNTHTGETFRTVITFDPAS